jgi:hypothetical protein
MLQHALNAHFQSFKQPLILRLALLFHADSTFEPGLSPTPVSTAQIYIIGPVTWMTLLSLFFGHFPASDGLVLSVSIR